MIGKSVNLSLDNVAFKSTYRDDLLCQIQLDIHS